MTALGDWLGGARTPGVAEAGSSLSVERDVEADGRALERAPSATVRRLIEADTQRADRRAARLKIALLTALIALYVAAPKALDARSFSSEPVPIVLGLFMMFALVEYQFARRMQLPRGIAIAFSIIDVALLLLLIFSFHRQYGQPIAFVLKAPTILYVFVLIALRAFRLDPAIIWTTGLAAAIGWIGLTALALNEGAWPRTRSFVEYIDGRAILVGAELDKVIAILAVTAVLALAVGRSRQFMVRALAEGDKLATLRGFFDKDVVRAIEAAPFDARGGEAGELRDGVIFTADIRGFSTYTQRVPPHDVVLLLNVFRERLGRIVERYEGTIDKFIGDGVLASFGCVKPLTDPAKRAIFAARTVFAEIEAWNIERAGRGEAPVRIGIALASGEAVFGMVGGNGRFEATIVGDPVNRATKLEAHNKALGSAVLCDRATFERAVAEGYDPAGAEIVRGEWIAGLDTRQDLVILERPRR